MALAVLKLGKSWVNWDEWVTSVLSAPYLFTWSLFSIHQDIHMIPRGIKISIKAIWKARPQKG